MNPIWCLAEHWTTLTQIFLWSCSSPLYFLVGPSCQGDSVNRFPLLCKLSLHSVDGVLCWEEMLPSDVILLVYICLFPYASEVIPPKSVYCLLYSSSFILSLFNFILYMVRDMDHFSRSCIWISTPSLLYMNIHTVYPVYEYPHHLLMRLSFPPIYILSTSAKFSCMEINGFISRFLIIFY